MNIRHEMGVGVGEGGRGGIKEGGEGEKKKGGKKKKKRMRRVGENTQPKFC